MECDSSIYFLRANIRGGGEREYVCVTVCVCDVYVGRGHTPARIVHGATCHGCGGVLGQAEVGNERVHAFFDRNYSAIT
jgi:hypothetical protein